jgi:heat shock protein HslJ
MAAAIVLAAAVCATCRPPGETAGTPPPAGVGSEGGAPGASSASGQPASALAGTSWRLVEFQSMDDAIGTLRPDDPSKYTMTLHGDGSVSMQLDCNRGTGTWFAEPAGDDGGSFRFGRLATTRALCPPPSLGERIARDAEFVRSYLLRDGRLHLGLMADAGIYAWQPESPGAFQATPDARLEAAILGAAPHYTREIVEIDGREARYVHGRHDLDGDGVEEVFVLLMGSIFCGTGGCNLLLLRETEGGYALVDDFPRSRAPVIVTSETTAGWHDLVRLESGGGAEPAYVVHAFDGERYVERERLPGDRAPEGVPVLAGDPTYEVGAPLEPRVGASATGDAAPAAKGEGQRAGDAR